MCYRALCFQKLDHGYLQQLPEERGVQVILLFLRHSVQTFLTCPFSCSAVCLPLSSYTIVLIYYAFCLVLMMLLRPLLVKKIACGLGKSDRFKSIYAALYFFPILTVLQAVGGGLLCECLNHTLSSSVSLCRWPCAALSVRLCLSDYAFPYIILVLSLVTLAVYMSASEIQVRTHTSLSKLSY